VHDKQENEQIFNWDVIDFIVPVNIIEDFLSTILQHGDNATCDAMKTRVEERNFVLYNAFCRQSVDQANFMTQHYYRHRRRRQRRGRRFDSEYGNMIKELIVNVGELADVNRSDNVTS
jgi:hypothetical protein